MTGELLDELSSWDALRAALPVGTVSGAPKVTVLSTLCYHGFCVTGIWAHMSHDKVLRNSCREILIQMIVTNPSL